jgi:hypothetical protein
MAKYSLRKPLPAKERRRLITEIERLQSKLRDGVTVGTFDTYSEAQAARTVDAKASRLGEHNYTISF